jgi:hypothetical protein
MLATGLLYIAFIMFRFGPCEKLISKKKKKKKKKQEQKSSCSEGGDKSSGVFIRECEKETAGVLLGPTDGFLGGLKAGLLCSILDTVRP